MSINKRLYFILAAAFIVVMAGSSGYYILLGAKPSFMDCLYMTVISLTTVGYGEIVNVTGNIPAQIFTMILITFGMGIILYGISTLTAIIVEGELSGVLRKKQMEKKINRLTNHYIVCGGGKTGRHVLDELIKNKEQVVLIEEDEEHIEQVKSFENLLYVKGDPTDDRNLIAAGIDRAAGIVICLPSDKENLYVTMTARMFNRKARIVCRMADHKIKAKLKKAGANSVVSPSSIGALRMASEMIRPTAVDFLDTMLRSSKGNLRINEINVSQGSSVVGKTVDESGLREKFELLLVGARHDKDDIEFNPSSSHVIEEGMTLIVMGDVDNIIKARKAF